MEGIKFARIVGSIVALTDGLHDGGRPEERDPAVCWLIKSPIANAMKRTNNGVVVVVDDDDDDDDFDDG